MFLSIKPANHDLSGSTNAHGEPKIKSFGRAFSKSSRVIGRSPKKRHSSFGAPFLLVPLSSKKKRRINTYTKYRFFLWKPEAQRKKLVLFEPFAKKKRREECFALCGARQAPFLKESVLDTKEFPQCHTKYRSPNTPTNQNLTPKRAKAHSQM